MASSRQLLIVGSKGMLAKKVAEQAINDWSITGVDLPDFDMTNSEQVKSMVKELNPDLIINCAAFTNVDDCETQEDLACQVNGTAVGFLAEASLAVDACLVHVSTDYVFPGSGNKPLSEEDHVAPQSAYGRSKLLGEEALVASGLKKYFILRTSWLYGPGGNNFVETILRLAKERDQLGIVADQIGSPTYTGDLAAAIFNLISHASPSNYGIYHFANDGACSWYDFAVAIVDQGRNQGEAIKVTQITPINTEDYPLPAKRPAYSVFTKEKYLRTTGMTIPSWQESLRQYFRERKKVSCS